MGRPQNFLPLSDNTVVIAAPCCSKKGITSSFSTCTAISGTVDPKRGGAVDDLLKIDTPHTLGGANEEGVGGYQIAGVFVSMCRSRNSGLNRSKSRTCPSVNSRVSSRTVFSRRSSRSCLVSRLCGGSRRPETPPELTCMSCKTNCWATLSVPCDGF